MISDFKKNKRKFFRSHIVISKTRAWSILKKTEKICPPVFELLHQKCWFGWLFFFCLAYEQKSQDARHMDFNLAVAANTVCISIYISEGIEDIDPSYLLYKCLMIWNFLLSYFCCPWSHLHGLMTAWKNVLFVFVMRNSHLSLVIG